MPNAIQDQGENYTKDKRPFPFFKVPIFQLQWA
jgi:hypothetical protein